MRAARERVLARMHRGGVMAMTGKQSLWFYVAIYAMCIYVFLRRDLP
jgi:hypothetical protein